MNPSTLAWAHPLVREWFERRLAEPTEAQAQGWPAILAGKPTLISAPTGSGKTLAAFLACIDRLVRKAVSGQLLDRTEVLYISPLKALGNDIQKNLEAPLGEILQLAGERGVLMPPIRTAVRTGDTLAHERRAMLARPPHILVTTPESLYILLTAAKSREILKDVETVIVDEIHAVADDKRGAHLALSIERLEALVTQSGRKAPVRIGLSATQKPLDLIARFLVGTGRPEPACVNIGHVRPLELAVEVPSSPLGAVASNEMWEEVYDRLAELAREHRSTLVFVNTRRLSERVAHHLRQRLGEEAVEAHHGSLARRLRLAAEKKLKSGEARMLVATASLELGIDIGTVDLVCQLGSPRSIAVALQRFGRSGHARGAVSKGRLFAFTRDELVECAALARSIRSGELDAIRIPHCPLDVLAQQVVAACAAEEWREDELFRLVRRAFPHRDLSRAEFDELAGMLSEGISARRGRYGVWIYRDRINGRLRGRRGARLAAIMNGGAIPETALYSVVAEPQGTPVGTVDEDFAVESLAGDIMLLGSTSWRIRRVESARGRLLVEDAHGAAPNVPFWRGEAPARTDELSRQVSDLREKVDALTAGATDIPKAVAWLKQECALNDSSAEQLAEYIVEGSKVLGAVPSEKTVVAERFFDEGGGMQLVIHAPFGGRINRAWGLALRKRFCRSFNFELQAAATENGLNISLGEQHSFPLAEVFHFLTPETVKPVLEQAALASPIFATRWRWDATRALALLRFRGGNKIPLPVQRILSDDLLASVFPDVVACQENIQGDIQIPAHPLIREVMKDVLTEAMDLEGLERVLRALGSGEIRALAVDTPAPSAFSHEILNANPYAYLDDAPLEERRARAVSLRRTLPESVLGEIGKLDPAAIAEVQESAWPDVRDADELDDALQTLVALPESFRPLALDPAASVWREFFERLVADGRATRAAWDGENFWVSAVQASAFLGAYPRAEFLNQPATSLATAAGTGKSSAPSSREDAVRLLVQGWVGHLGPVTAPALAKTLHLPESEIVEALSRLEAEGSVLRGEFTRRGTEWCDRRLLARIHRLTLGVLRKEIEPVTPAEFMRWLLRWQHLAPGTELRGERGVLEALRQLQGFEAPANAWEREILARRIAGYDPEVLDRLCLAGSVGWGRFSPHPAMLGETNGELSSGRRVVPTSVSPLAFFIREEADWFSADGRAIPADFSPRISPAAAEVLEFLRSHGASFFADLARGTGRLKSEIETALWELVSAGVVTADGFDNLRALIDPKRRAGQGRGRECRPRHSTGRWALLLPAAEIKPGDSQQAVESMARALLARYGVVFRELLARESFPVTWRALWTVFRRLEDRGEVRGGRFVDGFLGEQFALPVAVDSLRACRRAGPTGETIVVCAADPMNLVGIVVPGERVPANSGRTVAFRDGVAVAPAFSAAAM